LLIDAIILMLPPRFAATRLLLLRDAAADCLRAASTTRLRAQHAAAAFARAPCVIMRRASGASRIAAIAALIAA